MIIIPVKDGESIDRALKRFKKKFMKTGTMMELRNRREFTKKSVELRAQRIKAAYKEQLRREED
ncbi:MAG: 30S ribosomal protein S21 [Flavobacteriales bacterium]|nr:30S ribosomal protein S21 [Flavobacteriales bacterium]